MEADIEHIRETYLHMPNYKLEHMATHEVANLLPEAVEIMKEEIQIRNLDPALLAYIEIQSGTLTEEEIQNILDLIVNSRCPLCSRENPPLSGVHVRQIISVILVSFRENKELIACEDCIRKKKRTAYALTLLLGWWGIPHGVFGTPAALISNALDKKNRQKVSEEVLTKFVMQNLGGLRQHIHDGTEFIELIRRFNS